MFRNYFKTAFRNLQKNRLYSAINILGITVALASCLLIGIYIQHELSYDRFNANAARIVRVTMEYSNGGTVNKVATTGTRVGPEFKRNLPAVEEYVRTFIHGDVVKAGNQLFDEPAVLYADPGFFKIFSFKIIKGEAATALDAPDKIVLTRSMAKKYFGDADPINKLITTGGKNLRVSAVCEDAPQNSQLKFDFVTQFENLGNYVKTETWWNASWITYLLLKNPRDVNKFQQQVTSYMKSPAISKEIAMDGKDYLTYHTEPLTTVHLYSALAGFEPNGSITYIYMFGIIALLILVIACANYTNLATAQSAGRSGEISMRKVMGASRGQVFAQFMGESFLIAFIAALLAFGLSMLLIPAFNNITGRQFTTHVLLQPLPMLALLVFTFVISFFAGVYPALVLSATEVMGTLKKGFSFTGGNNILRKTLIVAQFAISVFLIIFTVIVLQQMNYMRTKNLGYNKDHLLVLPIGDNMQQFQIIKEAFLQVPGVEAVTASYDTPEYVQWGDGIRAIDEKGNHNVSVTGMPVDLDFTKTLQMQLVAGRDFQLSDFSLQDTSNNNANFRNTYLINETLAAKIGWTPQQAIGKVIERGSPGRVVGVVKDFNFSSLHNPIGPLLIFLGRDFARKYIVRIKDNHLSNTLAQLNAIWNQRINDRPFSYHVLDEAYNKLYLSEQRTSTLFTVAAGLAILLACLGLFALAAFTTVQRTKEIGIRRVLGATVGGITMLVAKGFLQLVILSVLIAAPFAWLMANKWLQDFAFRIPVQAYVFVAAAFVTVLIALCTVGYHSLKLSLQNPVKSLRTE